MPDPIVSAEADTDPEQEALLADSVGLALQVVLDTLAPAERLAFVLHDMFGVPFDEIAPIVGRSEAASRQLASLARRRVCGAPAGSVTHLARQREVVNAFMAAAREGDFDALLEGLDPDVVLRADGGTLAATGSLPAAFNTAVISASHSTSSPGSSTPRSTPTPSSSWWTDSAKRRSGTTWSVRSTSD